MTIVSIKTGTGEGLRRLELSDGSFFWLKLCYVPPAFEDAGLCSPGMAEGREIGADEEGCLRFASACLRAEKSALRLIARAEQCSFGLSRKLEQRGYDPVCVRQVVSRLAVLALVDDSRFARLWLENRLPRARSPRRLLAGLCARGIARNDAAAALSTVLDPAAEFALLERFVRKQLRRSRGAAGGKMAGNGLRLLKFALKGEGFSNEVIQRFLEGSYSCGGV
jgi:regulatory protein